MTDEKPVPPHPQGTEQLAQEYASNLPAPPGTNPDPVVIGQRDGVRPDALATR